MPSLSKESLSEQIKKILERRIVNLDINPGEKINLNELEEEFEVSRAPLREALQNLVEKGLVEVKPRVGYFAVHLDTGQIKDICEMRKLLEVYALEKSIDKISRTKLKTLKEKTLKIKKGEIPQEEVRGVFDEIDDQLHELLIFKANNQFLQDFTERLHNLIRLTRHLNERLEAANKEHLQLIRSILDKDLLKSKKILKLHLNNVEKEILKKQNLS